MPDSKFATKGNLLELAAAAKEKYEPKDATIVHDANYVHSDTNYTAADKAKLDATRKVFYGTCSTAASTAAKVVTCPEFKAADLVAGAIVIVKFSNAQSYNGTPTLNVNSTGADTIMRNGTTKAARYEWIAGEVVTFVHDGTNWLIADGGIATTSYYGLTKLTTSAVSTSTATSLTPAALNNVMESLVTGVQEFSTSASYAVGDRVRYGFYVYTCTTAHTAAAWDATHFEAMAPLLELIEDVTAITTAELDSICI